MNTQHSQSSPRRASPSQWRGLVTAIFEAAGSSAHEAGEIAEHLVASNLSGHDSHGIGVIPVYLQMLREGKIQPNRTARLVQGGGAFAVYDGQSGYGQPIANEVMRAAAETARRDGVALVALRNSHHVGRIGAYGEALAREGLASIHFVNALLPQPCVAPHNGRDARLATNPLCVTIPGRSAIVLDFATSAIALGKVRVALNKKVPVPDGCLIDASGEPTTAPETLFEEPRGALLPLGGHKGWCLAFVIELLGGALTGGGTAAASDSRQRGVANGMFTIAFDPGRFIAPAALQAEVDALAAYVKASPSRIPGEGVLLPGEPEAAMRRRRQEEGIEIDAATWSEIAADSAALGLATQRFDGFE